MNFSFTPKSTIIPAVKIIAPATKNEVLYPQKSAANPPIQGPMEAPVKTEVCIKPRPKPDLSRGIADATRAMAAVMVPVKRPWINRSQRSCWTFFANPIKITKMPPASIALSTMIFLPNLSASIPQMGAETISPNAGAVVRSPAQIAT